MDVRGTDSLFLGIAVHAFPNGDHEVFDLVQAVGLLPFEMFRDGKKQVVAMLVFERHALGPVIKLLYTSPIEQDDTRRVNVFADR